MKVETHACDQCKKQKQGANHWWRVFEVKDWHDSSKGALIISPWDTKQIDAPNGKGEVALDHDEGEKHICGAACMNEWLSKNLLN